MRLPHLTSVWPHLFTPFTQKMSEVLARQRQVVMLPGSLHQACISYVA